MNVPFLDINSQTANIRNEIDRAIAEVIDRGEFAGGHFVSKFEEEYAFFCESKYAVGVGSGTEALWLSLLAAGVQPGDEVITVPSTFMATAEAITYCGAVPVFVDVDPATYTMDPIALRSVISSRTKALIPVHLFGQAADMDPIMDIASEFGLTVVEDACQAHGAKYKGRSVGTIGQAGCFSFYPGKNLGALGEAGAVVTQSREMAETIKILRDHGQIRKYHHTMVGWNCRMDGIQAAVLSVKLPYLNGQNARRRSHAEYYDRVLADLEQVICPFRSSHCTHAYHVYAIRVQERDFLLRLLHQAGIGCGVHYPIPVHLQSAYSSLGYARSSFPVAERCAGEFVSLPMFPSLTIDQCDRVSRVVRSAVTTGVLA